MVILYYAIDMSSRIHYLYSWEKLYYAKYVLTTLNNITEGMNWLIFIIEKQTKKEQSGGKYDDDEKKSLF